MRDRKHTDLVRMGLEGNDVGETLNKGPPDRYRCALDVWPERIRVRSLCDPREHRGHVRDKLITQARALFVIPDRRGAELGARASG